MPSTQIRVDSPELIAYLGENAGGYTAAGSHHQDGSQDSFWPAAHNGRSPTAALSRLDIVQHGRLYMLADGVSLCADGKIASQLAVETTSNYYYYTTEAYPDSDVGRQQRLEDAVWQAHLALLNWDQKYFCWRSERHDDGVAHYFKRGQLSSLKPPLCPLCGGHLVGLQTTLIAALVRGNRLTIVGVGDSSAFRIPGRVEFGIDWVHSPHDEQFLGMPSLVRQSIIAQSFVLSPRDRLLLVSDGILRVLNQLHGDMGWQKYVRDRLDTTDLSQHVRNLIRDLDTWRLSRPHQRKLQDDLTITAVAVADEPSRREGVDNALTEYDALEAKQRSADVLPASAYDAFIVSAETALLHSDNPQLWQLYSSAKHGHALARLNESISFDDIELTELLRNAARLTRRTKEWMIAHQQIVQLVAWGHHDGDPNQVSGNHHRELISDLYSVDLRDETPSILPRLVDLLLNVADKLARNNRRDDASQYKSFANYLNTNQPRMSRSPRLPSRDEAVTSTVAENTQALEMQISQAIAAQDWRIAQELIIELNKLKGAESYNLDTESVDTRRVRRQQWHNDPPTTAVRNGTTFIEMPPATPEPNGSHILPPQAVVVPEPIFEQPIPSAPLPNMVVHSRNPVDLVRDAARLAFSAEKQDRNLSKAYELAREASKLHADLHIARADWEALWHNALHDFDLVDIHAATTIPLTKITQALQVARDIASILAQSQTLHLNKLNGSQAKNDNRVLAQWQPLIEEQLLPYSVGYGAWWSAKQLSHARAQLPQSKLVRSERPFAEARRLYNEAIWQAILAQGCDNSPLPTHRLNITTLLEEVIELQEAPWTDAAQRLQHALQSENVIVTAFYLHQLRPPENTSADEQIRHRFLQEHYTSAAWEHVFTMAERHKLIDDDSLQSARSELVNATFDVTHLMGAQGLRLSIIYSLLSLLIHDEDGPIVNGFYAYETKIPRQLTEDDFRRLVALRSSYINRAWRVTLEQARQRDSFYLPPSSRYISRIKPDSTTPEGRRLQAIRALLPLLTPAYDDWIEYSAIICEWRPPLTLTAPDQDDLQALKAYCIDQAWQFTLDVIQGVEQPELTTGRIHQLKARLAELETDNSRLQAIAQLLPLLQQIKTPNTGQVDLARAAEQSALETVATLNDADARALYDVCALPMQALWQWTLKIAFNPFSTQTTTVRREQEALELFKIAAGDDGAVWRAIQFLLSASAQRLDSARKFKWEQMVKEIFKAYRVLNVVRNQSNDMQDKNQQLHKLTYHYMVEWKDSLPERPSFWRRRRVNVEKRRIQGYWQLRQEYGTK